MQMLVCTFCVSVCASMYSAGCASQSQFCRKQLFDCSDEALSITEKIGAPGIVSKSNIG